MEGNSSMIEYTSNISNISENDLEPFFDGWGKKPSLQKRLRVIRNSSLVILAMDGNKLTGFINAITDKTLSAYIPLLEVLPEYRKRGIGSKLVKKMTELLQDFYMIDLCCDEKLAGFYEKQGMKKVSGMIKRNYDKC